MNNFNDKGTLPAPSHGALHEMTLETRPLIDRKPLERPQEKGRRRQGKASAAKNQDAYRKRHGQPIQDALIDKINEKFGLLATDDDRKLQQVIDSMKVVSNKRAIPLSVSTRGVGFTTSIVYDRSCITWNLHAISAIITIHQIFRVHLWLFHLKMYLAQQIQTEAETQPGLLRRIVLRDEIRELLMTVTQVPSAFAMVLDVAGKVDTPQNIYHLGYPEPLADDDDPARFRSLVMAPDTMRNFVEAMADIATPVEIRNDIILHNSIPGANYVGGILQNPNDVWPADYEQLLVQEVHAYKLWITRVQPRLPKAFFTNVEWSGRATSGALWSTERTNAVVTSTFADARAAGVLPIATRRNARGERIVPDNPVGAAYTGSMVRGDRCEFWSRESTSHMSVITGIGGLVGEISVMATRHEAHSAENAVQSPVAICYALCDAPR